MESASAPRHLDIGGVFDATGEIYKRSFGTVWVVALVILVPAAIVEALLGGEGLLGFIGSLVHLAASAWLAGSIVRVVQDVEGDGRVDMGIGSILSSVLPLLLPLIVLQIIYGICVAIGLVLLIVPGVIIALVWAVALPAMVVEEKGVFDSFGRSADLTRDNRMRILGVGLLILLIYVGVAIVGGLLIALSPIIGVLALIVIGVLLYPYVSIISAVLYYRLRELKEGGVAAGGMAGAGGPGGAVVVEETVVVEEERRPPQP